MTQKAMLLGSPADQRRRGRAGLGRSTRPAATGSKSGVAVLGVGQIGIGGRHATEELTGVGGVAGALVEVGQDVPLTDVTLRGMAEVAAGAGGGEDFDRRVQLALVGQIRGEDHATLGQDVG